MFTRILVPLDGSDFGDSALPLAAALARRSEAALELVHAHEHSVYATGAPVYDPRLDDELKVGMQNRFAKTRERVEAYLMRETRLTWLEGPVAGTLAEHVAESGADLVVMATHGRGGLSRALMGSVADHMGRHSPAPVLFVRPSASGIIWRGEPLLRRIVIPLDGSELAECVIDQAVMLATPGETELLLLQVVAPFDLASHPYITASIALDEDYVDRRQRAAETYLEGVARELRSNGFATTIRVTAHEQVADGILGYAEHADADLIALATHGHGAVARLLLGSVADKVLRAATIPLLMFRPSPDDIERLAGTTAQALVVPQAATPGAPTE